MMMGDLVTLAQSGLDVKIVVMKNNTLGLIKWEQMLYLGNPEYGVDLAPVDFVKVAEEALRPAIRAGVPIVGLEPSCVSGFRDEMLNLMPEDADAQRLSKQTRLLSEFLVRDADWDTSADRPQGAGPSALSSQVRAGRESAGRAVREDRATGHVSEDRLLWAGGPVRIREGAL